MGSSGCALLATGILLYLNLPHLPTVRHALPLWVLYGLALISILGGLGQVAHSIALHNLGNRYAIICVALMSGGTAYLWLDKQVAQCSRLASKFAITHPKFACGWAFGLGTIWFIYIAMLFVTSFMRGMSTTGGIENGPKPNQKTARLRAD